MRVFVVHSEEREQYERGLRQMSMERVRKELEGLQARVEKGELKAAEKIGAAAAHMLARHHGGRYFAWEGKYVIQTEEPHLTAVQAVGAYKQN